MSSKGLLQYGVELLLHEPGVSKEFAAWPQQLDHVTTRFQTIDIEQNGPSVRALDLGCANGNGTATGIQDPPPGPMLQLRVQKDVQKFRCRIGEYLNRHSRSPEEHPNGVGPNCFAIQVHLLQAVVVHASGRCRIHERVIDRECRCACSANAAYREVVASVHRAFYYEMRAVHLGRGGPCEIHHSTAGLARELKKAHRQGATYGRAWRIGPDTTTGSTLEGEVESKTRVFVQARARGAMKSIAIYGRCHL